MCARPCTTSLGYSPHLPLETCLDQYGVSSYEIHRALGITQNPHGLLCILFVLRCRTAQWMKLGGNGIHPEVDEMFIGGKARNMHRDERAKLNAIGWDNKNPLWRACLSAIAKSGLRSSRIALRPQVLQRPACPRS